MDFKLTFEEYNRALGNNRLLSLKCAECGLVNMPPRLTCACCGSIDLSIHELSGSGTIRTFTVINIAPEGRENEAPYIIVMVELEEGPWLMANLTGQEPAAASPGLIGKQVQMRNNNIFAGDRFSGGPAAVPVFELA